MRAFFRPARFQFYLRRGALALSVGLVLVAITYLFLGGPEADCGYELGGCIPPGRWTMLTAIVALLLGSGLLTRDSRVAGNHRLALVAISLSTSATLMISWALRSSDRTAFSDAPAVVAALVVAGVLCGLAAIVLSWRSVDLSHGTNDPPAGASGAPRYERSGSA